MQQAHWARARHLYKRASGRQKIHEAGKKAYREDLRRHNAKPAYRIGVPTPRVNPQGRRSKRLTDGLDIPIFNPMVEYSPRLDGVFGALADPTRRAILQRLESNPARVTDIARHFPVSLNAVSKHLIVLERAGLIRREINGRDHICRLDAEPLQEASAWMMNMHAFWEERFDALERHMVARRRRRR